MPCILIIPALGNLVNPSVLRKHCTAPIGCSQGCLLGRYWIAPARSVLPVPSEAEGSATKDAPSGCHHSPPGLPRGVEGSAIVRASFKMRRIPLESAYAPRTHPGAPRSLPHGCPQRLSRPHSQLRGAGPAPPSTGVGRAGCSPNTFPIAFSAQGREGSLRPKEVLAAEGSLAPCQQQQGVGQDAGLCQEEGEIVKALGCLGEQGAHRP